MAGVTRKVRCTIKLIPTQKSNTYKNFISFFVNARKFCINKPILENFKLREINISN